MLRNSKYIYRDRHETNLKIDYRQIAEIKLVEMNFTSTFTNRGIE